MGLQHHVATSEQDYTREETEVLKAIMKHREATGRIFTTPIELVRFLKSLGYEKKPDVSGDVSKLPALRQPRMKKFLPPPPDDLV